MGTAIPDAPPTPKRETWRDWMPKGAPEPKLLTEEELFDLLTNAGISIAPGDLRTWQQTGIVPWGDTDRNTGIPNRLYPHWIGDLLRRAHDLLNEGHTAAEIGAELRAVARLVAKRGAKQTWRDWVSPDDPEPTPDDLLTRDELLEELNHEGLRVSVDDIRNWQLAGVIPYAVKQWHGGATRSLYPVWMVDVIRDLRRLQGEGYKLRQIGPLLPVNERMRRAFATSDPVAGSARWAATNHARDLVDIEVRLRAVAQSHEQRTGTRIERVEVSLELADNAPQFWVRLYDDRGHPLTYDLSEKPVTGRVEINASAC